MVQNRYPANISNEELEEMELIEFEEEIIVVERMNRLYYQAIEELRNAKILGFDTETKPSFRAHSPRNKVAILQLSAGEKNYIFRLQLLGIPKELADILSDPNIIKVGAAVKEDVRGLNAYTSFEGKGFVDLQEMVGKYGIEVKSLKKMAAIILGERISKSQQLSNWEAQVLTEAQLRYAAIDAWVCREMYLTLIDDE